jgi:hypothetical protein
VIARLRARHRGAWLALALVAPAVLAAGLAGRRGEAARQELPAELLAPQPPLTADSPRTASGDAWGWARDPASGALVLRVEEPLHAAWIRQPAPETLLYWSIRSTPEINAWVHRDSPRSEDERDLLRERLSESPLPEDAVLLGRWPARGEGRWVLPGVRDPDEATRGVVVWYSLGWSRVLQAEPSPGLQPEPP